MNDIIALAITGSVALAVGILLGMSWQHKHSDAYIKRLEVRVKELEERAAAAEIGHLQTAVAIAWDFLNDDDDEFDQDDPEYVAGAEATLRTWAEADAREAAGE